VKKSAAIGSDSEEASTVGKMPPSDDEDEEDRANDEEDFGELG
jgi:hypothetical protein